MELLGVGVPELLLILIVALIILGTERLPETAMKVGRTIQEFRRVTTGVTEQIARELQIEEWQRQARQMEQEARQATQLFPPSHPAQMPPVQPSSRPVQPSSTAEASSPDPVSSPAHASLGERLPPAELPRPAGTVPNRSEDVFGRPPDQPATAPADRQTPDDPIAGKDGQQPSNGRVEPAPELPRSTEAPASRVTLDPGSETAH